jgi:hypothetical protein
MLAALRRAFFVLLCFMTKLLQFENKLLQLKTILIKALDSKFDLLYNEFID